LFGWQVQFVPLPGPKGIVMVYPHTSNWDFIVGVLFRNAVGLDARWLGKDSLFRGPMGALMRRLGGIAVDRSAARGVAAALVDRFRAPEPLWLAIAPEGTRSHVDQLKSGFYRIAHGAGVPCGLGFIDYGTRTVGITEYVRFSGDEAADLATLQRFYGDKRGRRPQLAGRISFGREN
jgi:1-acyl-sn-glycerol-3-phosphate acyltransferase